MRRSLLTTLCLAVLATSCGIGTEERSRPIIDREQDSIETASAAVDAGPATGSARIYLLSPKVDGVSRTIEPVARNVQQPLALLESLLSGPNELELDRQLRTAIPANTRLLSIRSDSTVLTIDVSAEIEEISGEALVQAIAQLVFTADGLSGVSAVRITVEGRARQWPAPNGALQDLLLTSYSFPGLLLSSQPAYPPIAAQP